jgi:hypothetical protein
MKPVFRIMFALLAALGLLISQAGPVRGAESSDTPKGSCCGERHCPTTCCVSEDSSSPAGSQPALPASLGSVEFQLAPLPALVGLIADGTMERIPSGSFFDFPSAGSRVPIFLRTHSFLI